jgi:hypothetical protein
MPNQLLIIYEALGSIIHKQWVLGKITVVCIKIDNLVIKMMVLEEQAGKGDGLTGRRSMRGGASGVIRPWKGVAQSLWGRVLCQGL